jgi:O-antigen ligase
MEQDCGPVRINNDEQMSTVAGNLSNDTAIKTEKLRFLLIALLVFSLPYDLFYSSVILITVVAITLVTLKREAISRIRKEVWVFQVTYFLAAAGYFYSYHKHDAGFLLERQLAILLFPLLLPLAIRISRRRIETILFTLMLSCCLAISLLFYEVIHIIIFTLKLSVSDTLFSGVFFNHQFSKPLGIHAGYLSLYVALSIFYTVQQFNRRKLTRDRILFGIPLLILFAGLFFLASRNTIIATFFVLVFIFPFFTIKNKKKYVIVITACLFGSFLLVRNIPYLNDRFSRELVSDIRPVGNGSYINYLSAEPRIERWKGAVSLIARSPVFGYGTGDEIAMLRTEYIKRGLYISYLENFNAHNQYLSYLIKNGIMGLFVFLLAFYYYLRLSLRARDFYYLSFLTLLLIGFYTENILDANKGIVFFALFNSAFGYNCLQEQKQLRQEGAHHTEL